MIVATEKGKATYLEGATPEDLTNPEVILRATSELERSRIVVIRDLPGLTDRQLNAFLCHFGYVRHNCMAAAPVHRPDSSEHIGNMKPIGIIDFIAEPDSAGTVVSKSYAKDWHLDQSYFRQPAKDVVIYCVDPSADVVRTHFCDMQDVLDEIPEHIVRELRGKSIVYAFSVGRAGKVVHTLEGAEEDEVTHPLIIRNPRTGRESLYYAEHKLVRFVGLDPGIEQDLRSMVGELVESGRFTYSHPWRAGDVLLYDGAVMLHRRDEIPGVSRRHVKILNTIFEIGKVRVGELQTA